MKTTSSLSPRCYIVALLAVALAFFSSANVFSAPLNKDKVKQCLTIAADASTRIKAVKAEVDEFNAAMQKSLNANASQADFQKAMEQSTQKEAEAKAKIKEIKVKALSSINAALANGAAGSYPFEDKINDPSFVITDLQLVSAHGESGSKTSLTFLVQITYSATPKKGNFGIVRKVPQYVAYEIVNDAGAKVAGLGFMPLADKNQTTFAVDAEALKTGAKFIITRVDW